MCDHKEWYALDIITKALVPKLEVHQQILQKKLATSCFRLFLPKISVNLWSDCLYESYLQ